MLRKGEIGEIYNIGGGNEITNRELTDRVLALCGAGEEMIEYVDDRLGHDRRYSVDCSKVRSPRLGAGARASTRPSPPPSTGTGTTAPGGNP